MGQAEDNRGVHRPHRRQPGRPVRAAHHRRRRRSPAVEGTDRPGERRPPRLRSGANRVDGVGDARLRGGPDGVGRPPRRPRGRSRLRVRGRLARDAGRDDGGVLLSQQVLDAGRPACGGPEHRLRDPARGDRRFGGDLRR